MKKPMRIMTSTALICTAFACFLYIFLLSHKHSDTTNDQKLHDMRQLHNSNLLLGLTVSNAISKLGQPSYIYNERLEVGWHICDVKPGLFEFISIKSYFIEITHDQKSVILSSRIVISEF